MSKTENYGVGMDVGTMNLVAARRQGKEIMTNRMRDLFLALPLSARKMLRLSNTSFTERGDEVLILGDAALLVASTFGQAPRRPLVGGLISPGEMDSLEVLGLLVQAVLGKPRVENEICYFSVPAAPLDVPGQDTVYHQGIFERIIRDCGYDPFPSNEAMAVLFAETADTNFTGVGLSFGSGMTNVAMGVKALEGLAFSVARGGDWIDNGAAKATGSSAAQICTLKESGVDLNNPTTRQEEALGFYYKNLIEYVLDNVAREFARKAGQFTLTEPIPIVVSGGTSLAGGFMDIFESVFARKRRKFPIKISEIRQAQNPLNAVALGLMVQAMEEYRGD